MSEAACASKVVREGEQRVTVKLRSEGGEGVERYSPPFGEYLRVWRSRQQQSDKRAAQMEREVEQHRRDMRDMGDRKRMHAAQCTREEELAMRQRLEQMDLERRDALKRRRHAESEAAKRAGEAAQCDDMHAENTCLQQQLTRACKHAASLQKSVTSMERRLEEKTETVAGLSAVKQVNRRLQRDDAKRAAALRDAQESAQNSLDGMREQLASQQAEAQAREAELEAQLAQMASRDEQTREELEGLRRFRRERTPAPRRKATEELQPRQKRQRHQDARGRLGLALADAELNVKDVAAALEAAGMVDVLPLIESFHLTPLWALFVLFLFQNFVSILI